MMKKFSFKKIAMLGFAAIMAVSAMSASAFAAEYKEIPEDGVLSGVAGDAYIDDNGIVIEFIDEAECDTSQIMPYTSTPTWGDNGITLKGRTSFTDIFELDDVYKWFKVYYENTGDYAAILNVVGPASLNYSRTVTIPKGAKPAQVYRTSESPAGTYTVSLTSGDGLYGVVNVRIASSFNELDIKNYN